MTTLDANEPNSTTKTKSEAIEFNTSIRQVLAIVILAVFGVLTHWGVWDQGVYSMGWNTSLFYLMLIALLIFKNEFIDLKRDWRWLAPLALVSISFGLYENPWLKVISFLVMPVIVSVFFTFGHLSDKYRQIWRSALVLRLAKGAISALSFLPDAMMFVAQKVACSARLSSNGVAKRVLKAVIILIPLLFVILILLSSADAKFGQQLGVWFGSIFDFLNWSLVSKVIWIFVVTSLILATCTGLRRPTNYLAEPRESQVDGLVAAIVLSCIFIFYVLFLSFQLEYLLVDRLPIEFDSTERMVKSGFWQLFFLSGINVSLFCWVYKNTGAIAQWILRAYLLASVLILLSACWRMALYVYFYGLSYEKFFASYTALYALALFAFLGCAVFSTTRRDIVKFAVFSSLWMFSISTVLPIERVIFSSNLALSKRVDSRVDLRHLSVLSVDIMGLVRKNIGDSLGRDYWQGWLAMHHQKYCGRVWYETNISLLTNCDATE